MRLASAGAANPARPDSFQHNVLLRGLPAVERERIADALEVVDMPTRTVLYEANKPIAYVHFPLSGVLSLLALDASDDAVEVGTIGNEGMSGLSLFHGMPSAPQQCIAQVEGRSARMAARRFMDDVPAMPQLTARIHRYTQAFFNDVAQSVACNRMHSIEQRCARWLLMTHDRVEGDEFFLTQQFLAYMLGTRRESVSAVARALQKRGCIQYSRGLVEIVDRERLEAASCSCYATTRSAYALMAKDGQRSQGASARLRA